MASNWEPDQPVINYLTRRVKYYKKVRGSINNRTLENKFLIDKYGKRELKRLISIRTIQINERITEYQTAISVLTRSHKFKKYRQEKTK